MIEIRNLKKKINYKSVLKGVNLNIEDGKITVIIGRSGCGKTVLVKHIIGLMKPDSGEILMDGKRIDNLSHKEWNVIRKNFAMLFQGSALFDSMSVFQNLALPLFEHTELPLADIKKKVEEKLSLVGMSGMQEKMPSELSGGMKKRVGLARAIIMEPKYIIYDEPTTGLDPITAETVDNLIIKLKSELKLTSLVVTHDIQSVYKIADKVAMLHNGMIIFTGSVDEIKNCKNLVVKEFIEVYCSIS